jgi:hypothetical protein
MSDSLLLATLQRAGWSNDLRLDALRVTGNNHVVVGHTGDRALLIKQYFQHPDDPRDRFETERAFYEFLWNAGVKSVPEPLAWYRKERVAVLEYVEGEKPKRATQQLVDQAIEFLVEINRLRDAPSASALPLASEACFGFGEHLATVERRIARLRQIAPQTPRHEQAIEFIRDRIEPAWTTLRKQIETNLPANAQTLSTGERIISPSDFGFHNAIHGPEGRLRFFDFEYAGWDDPAKTMCDFFCQPAVPVPNEWMPSVVARVSDEIGSHDLAERVRLLLPVYRTKWCCIMLNDFLPSGNERRAFSNPDLEEHSRWEGQLAKAREFHQSAFP